MAAALARNPRRLVTGRAADGSSVVVSDGPAPRHHDFVAIPGMSATLVWATDGPEPGSGADPTPSAQSWVPAPGGSRFLVLVLPPDAVMGSPDFDGAAAGAEQAAVVPGLAELFEPEAPAMHTTPTVDYALVLDGTVWLELDDGVLTELEQGALVIQNGTRHGWHNLGTRPVTLAFVLMGTG